MQQILKKNQSAWKQKDSSGENLKAGTARGSLKGRQPISISYKALNVKMNDLLHTCLFLVSTFHNSKISLNYLLLTFLDRIESF